jgi:hypothetical protein
MKCKYCDGTGKSNMYKDGAFVDCMYCCGTGEMEVEMTNEEWIKSANTEQLAEVIGNIAKNAYQCCQDGKTNKCVNRNHCTGYCDYGWGEWLKQPHHESVSKCNE